MPSIESARVIDCHAHVRIEIDMGPDWQHGPEYGVDDKGHQVRFTSRRLFFYGR